MRGSACHRRVGPGAARLRSVRLGSAGLGSPLARPGMTRLGRARPGAPWLGSPMGGAVHGAAWPGTAGPWCGRPRRDSARLGWSGLPYFNNSGPTATTLDGHCAVGPQEVQV